MKLLISELYVLFATLCLFAVTNIIIDGIKVYFIGRIKRLKLMIEMLKQEYITRNFSNPDEMMDNLEYACDYSNEILYNKRGIKKYKKKALTLFLILTVSLVGMSFTYQYFNETLTTIREAK